MEKRIFICSKNGMYGKHLTDEQKNNISKKLKGRTRSLSECIKTSESLKGVPKSKEHIENMIKASLGKDYYREVIIIDENKNIVMRFKNKSEYYREMNLKYGISRTFLEVWIKKKDFYFNTKKKENLKILENKKVIYIDEFI